MIVLAVDPGREKCGLAVCGPGGVQARMVVRARDLWDAASRLVREHGVDTIIVGDQTSSEHTFDILRRLAVPVALVPERGSTLRARGRYFQDHRPRGWRRFWPLMLQVPPEPYDDYTAVVLAEEYLRASPEGLREDRERAPSGPGEY